jgi:hypothetical protein
MSSKPRSRTLPAASLSRSTPETTRRLYGGAAAESRAGHVHLKSFGSLLWPTQRYLP